MVGSTRLLTSYISFPTLLVKGMIIQRLFIRSIRRQQVLQVQRKLVGCFTGERLKRTMVGSQGEFHKIFTLKLTLKLAFVGWDYSSVLISLAYTRP